MFRTLRFGCTIFTNEYHADELCNKHGFGKENIRRSLYFYVSYDVASGSDIMPCIKIDKPLVGFTDFGNVMY